MFFRGFLPINKVFSFFVIVYNLVMRFEKNPTPLKDATLNQNHPQTGRALCLSMPLKLYTIRLITKINYHSARRVDLIISAFVCLRYIAILCVSIRRTRSSRCLCFLSVLFCCFFFRLDFKQPASKKGFFRELNAKH